MVIFWETALPEIIYDEDGKTIVVEYDSKQVVLEVRREEDVELIANILNDGEIDGCDWRAFELTDGRPGLNIIHGARVNSWLDTFIV